VVRSSFVTSSASASLITKAITLVCHFPHSPEQELCFLLTPLNSTVGAVLGHYRLKKNNLDINWTTSSIRTFCPTEAEPPPVSQNSQPPLAPDDPVATLQACNETRSHHWIPLIFPYILIPISTLALLSHDP